MDVYGSPNLIDMHHVCRAPSMAASYYTWGGSGLYTDYAKAQCIVEWGANPAVSHYPTYRNILQQKQRGAQLIVIDPYHTKLASQANLWLQPRPGTDGALTIGMLKVIIDESLYDHRFVHNWTYGFAELRGLTRRYSLEDIESITWVPKSKIAEAACLYAKTRPACIYDGGGLDMHTNTFQTLRAIEILRAITGNLDVPGGDLIPSLPIARLRLPQMALSEMEPVGKCTHHLTEG